MIYIIFLHPVTTFICLTKNSMDKQIYRGVIISILFVWTGMLLGISFLEAPLKFQAPNITLAIGVTIGRLIFSTLNKIEIFFSLILLILLFYTDTTKSIFLLFGLVACVLSIQSFWLLPELDVRAKIIMSGNVPLEKSPHILYVAGEVIKLLTIPLMEMKFFLQTINLSAIA